MKSSKFIVVKLQEVIKTAVFAVLGVIILIGLITFFLNMGNEDTGLYHDGTYEAELILGEESAKIAVEIENGKIAEITFSEIAEAVTVMYPMSQPALSEIAAQVVQTQSTQNLEISEQYTHTAQQVVQAVENCLTQAKQTNV